jgi:hypothetical protein
MESQHNDNVSADAMAQVSGDEDRDVGEGKTKGGKKSAAAAKKDEGERSSKRKVRS